MSCPKAGFVRSKPSLCRQRILRPWALFLALLAGCLAVQAQQQGGTPLGPSDLATQNLGRVAASPAQIEEVLRKDPGLLVELKRWVAKEATDRGQIVDDSDLSDQGIFNRLALDPEFRSVATRLLQRYGYLIPKLNPESDAAKENEVLVKERARRLLKAEAEEEEAERESRRAGGKLDRTGSRASAPDRAAVEEKPREPERRMERIYTAEATESGALEPRAKTIPREPTVNPLEETEIRSRQLAQTAMQTEPGLPQRSRDLLGSPSNLDMTAAESRLVRGPEIQERTVASERVPEVEPYRREQTPSGFREREIERDRHEELDRPVIVRKANPYADIPSLYEMYAQVSARPPVLKRFGADVFRYGTRDSEFLPMDLPVGPDYVVGPGDGLAIDLWGSVSQRIYRTVDQEGRVGLPEVGPVLVSGRTLAEVQQSVQQILRTQFRDVSADVSLSRLRSIRVYVVGDVEKPGAYDISSLSTPLNALFAAGGATPRGSLRILRHYRGKQLVQEVDAYDLILRGVRSDLGRLQNGDTVMVPPIGPQVTVEGMVRRPAIYELRAEKTLAEVIQMAGGILTTAALHNIQVQRIEAHQKRTMLSLNISEAQDGEAVGKQLEAFEVRDGDEIRIFPIAPYNQDAVYLQGHVLRPGRYSYRSNMKLTDLVASYGDLLPEPAAKYAEIIRLNPPDYRPSVESFNLSAALANPAAAPELQPMDTVRIFSRYDFENPPTIWVGGEVRNPGSYRASGQIHLRDAVHLAGGPTLDALLENAQVFRYLPDSKLKIFSVHLEEAMAGNPLDNIILQPRDRILVHRNMSKVDPPSVFVKGEIAKPGRYPLTTNMRIGDLIRVAGGLKRSAYGEAADLTRYLSPDSPQRIGEHREIRIAAALAGEPEHDLPLRDGDTLAIRQLPGWSDIGASIVVRGEVQHPGVYGIQPGERLSAVLKRAGGFRPSAYPQAAVLDRVEIRELQEKSRLELIRRIAEDADKVKVSLTEEPQEQVKLQKAALEQRQRVLQRLKETPVSGRLVVRLQSDIATFENSPHDIEVRAGDTLYVPKRLQFVVVDGQVYIPNAITFVPRKNAGWYLSQAGGPTKLADKKEIFIVRANGSVVSEGGEGWWGGDVLSMRMEPGDMIVVPEKPISGSSFWRNAATVAQIASSVGIAAAVITRK